MSYKLPCEIQSKLKQLFCVISYLTFSFTQCDQPLSVFSCTRPCLASHYAMMLLLIGGEVCHLGGPKATCIVTKTVGDLVS